MKRNPEKFPSDYTTPYPYQHIADGVVTPVPTDKIESFYVPREYCIGFVVLVWVLVALFHVPIFRRLKV